MTIGQKDNRDYMFVEEEQAPSRFEKNARIRQSDRTRMVMAGYVHAYFDKIGTMNESAAELKLHGYMYDFLEMSGIKICVRYKSKDIELYKLSEMQHLTNVLDGMKVQVYEHEYWKGLTVLNEL